jgi:2-C-methyl-D-erythritol 2,4-cyclodiphosphate synthase/2-C-methyl-D-erythritol 4-phosphate cytidylyltransferase/2-C-methyl-D-erythritol 2,4-cyclodiphosphate synthase
MNENNYSIGLGRDIHPLVPGRRFVLGGVLLDAEAGEEGHSDGDVLCHAIIDALLGALRRGDIGELFPPGGGAYKDACSLGLLRHCVSAALAPSPWRISGIDAVVSCKSPVVLPYREAIRRSLSDALGVREEQVFVKGKSGNGVGEVGQGRAVEALAVCLLARGV